MGVLNVFDSSTCTHTHISPRSKRIMELNTGVEWLLLTSADDDKSNIHQTISYTFSTFSSSTSSSYSFKIFMNAFEQTNMKKRGLRREREIQYCYNKIQNVLIKIQVWVGIFIATVLVWSCFCIQCAIWCWKYNDSSHFYFQWDQKKNQDIPIYYGNCK